MIKPARKITNVRGKKNTGYFPSKKMKRNIEFESLLERDYFYWLEYDKSVKLYAEQPVTIEFKVNNKKRKYTPDCYFETIQDKKYLVEIKPKNKLDKILKSENDRLKYDAAYKYCNDNDMKFIIVTDEQIKKGNSLENIKYLYGYSHMEVPNSYKKAIIEFISNINSIQIEDILGECFISDEEKSYQYLMSMIYNSDIFIDMNTRLIQTREKTVVFIEVNSIV